MDNDTGMDAVALVFFVVMVVIVGYIIVGGPHG
jgi:hypothetical protein